MMKLTVKYFASMREVMGKAEEQIELDLPSLTIKQLWSSLTDKALPANTLVAINMEYSNINDQLHDNDEVAFFPPVTGG